MWYEGLLQLHVWQIAIITGIMIHVSVIGVTVYLHRYSAHRALELHPVVKHFFRFWLWLTTAMNTKEWTAVHRKHHAKCETEEDPHSPVIHGLKKVLFLGVMLYRKTAHNPQVLEKYGKGTPDDWIENHLYTGKYKNTGIKVLFIINILLFGYWGLFVWGIQMIWFPLFAAGVVNGVGHHTGYRNFECPDASRNIVPWGIIIGGEELHNNHHTFPNSAKLSVKWWEFDIGWFWIRIMSFFGLAKVQNRGPLAYRVEGKTAIDNDTTLAVLNNRFQILAQYRKRVVSPLIKREMEKADAKLKPLFKKAKKLFTREESLASSNTKEKIKSLLDESHVLQVIYEKHKDLQAIWQKTTHNTDEKLKALKEWCKQAEESGIKKLQEFANMLKTYSLSPVPA